MQAPVKSLTVLNTLPIDHDERRKTSRYRETVLQVYVLESAIRRIGSHNSKSQVAKVTCFDEVCFFEEAFEWVRVDVSLRFWIRQTKSLYLICKEWLEP